MHAFSWHSRFCFTSLFALILFSPDHGRWHVDLRFRCTIWIMLGSCIHWPVDSIWIWLCLRDEEWWINITGKGGARQGATYCRLWIWTAVTCERTSSGFHLACARMTVTIHDDLLSFCLSFPLNQPPPPPFLLATAQSTCLECTAYSVMSKRRVRHSRETPW